MGRSEAGSIADQAAFRSVFAHIIDRRTAWWDASATSCSRRLRKNGSGVTRRPVCDRARVVKAVSISVSVAAFRNSSPCHLIETTARLRGLGAVP
jgi:hypothetical protein